MLLSFVVVFDVVVVCAVTEATFSTQDMMSALLVR